VVNKLETACVRWLERPSLQFATGLVLAAVLAVGSASQLWVNWQLSGLDPSFRGLLELKAAEWSLWAAAMPLVVALDRRIDWADGWVRSLTLHALAATAVFLLINLPVATMLKTADAMLGSSPWGARYLGRAAYRLPSAWVSYATLLGGVTLVRAFVRSQRLDRDLTQAQLRALRDQIQPHFLFNTLHTVGSLVRADDRAGAVETLVALSDLLRRSLNHGREETVLLSEELDFLTRYLDIQRRRFGAQLAVDIDVPEPLTNARVPPFLLQPLVENAIRHGLDLERARGEVRVVARTSAGTLQLRVEDSGDALSTTPDFDGDGDGLGLANLRSRLVTLYGAKGGLTAQTIGQRTVVAVTLPLRQEPP
jgi:hypothetical protein